VEKGKYCEPSETGTMHELGNVQHAAQAARALRPARNELHERPRHTARIVIADDDAAAAVVRDPRQTEYVQYDTGYSRALLSSNRQAGPKAHTKPKPAARATSSRVVYSDPGKQLLKLEKEIRAIDAYDGFLLGIYDKIEKFPKRSEFDLGQVLDVEKRMAEAHENLELYKFTLRRTRARALKALRCQGNLGPQRVLNLLKDNIAKQIAAAWTAGEQAVAGREEGT
jgi:hypothetical protein